MELGWVCVSCGWTIHKNGYKTICRDEMFMKPCCNHLLKLNPNASIRFFISLFPKAKFMTWETKMLQNSEYLKNPLLSYLTRSNCRHASLWWYRVLWEIKISYFKLDHTTKHFFFCLLSIDQLFLHCKFQVTLCRGRVCNTSFGRHTVCGICRSAT